MNVLGFTITRDTSARRPYGTAIALLSTGAVVCTGGAAFAVWSANGSGTGSAAASTSQALTTTASTAAGTALYPGGTGDLRITYSNPNPFPVTVTSLALTSGGVITAAGGIGTCTTTGVSLTSPQTVSHLVPAKTGSTNGSAAFTVAGALSMNNSSDNGCQGATFTVPVTITGASS